MTSVVKIVSIGPGDPALLNEKTMEVLLTAEPLILRTEHHAFSSFLQDKGIPYLTLDDFYDSAGDFDGLSDALAEAVWKAAESSGKAVYAVPDVWTDRSVDTLYRICPSSGSIEVIPGFSYADFYLSACRGFFSAADIRICPAHDFESDFYNPSRPVLITELNDAITTGEIKIKLSRFVNDEETVYFLGADGNALPVRLFELDRQPFYNHLSAVAVPGKEFTQRNRKTVQDLAKIMDILRSPGGCPWDRSQTHVRLRTYVTEEAWEVVDAIDGKDPVHLAEELGDLLFQVIFHTSIAQSFDEFTLDDVVSGICDKMIRRHPHVFGSCKKPSEFNEAAWDRIKQEEQGAVSLSEALKNVSEALPSLRYAEKVFRKIRNASVNTVSADQIICAVREQADLLSADENICEKTIVKILLLCTELSQVCGIDSEVILHQAVKNVVQNAERIEKEGKKGILPAGLLDF